MNFHESLKILGIEEYGERIFNSNSHGELLHLYDYISLAESIGETDWFKKWFNGIVKQAEEKLERPESVFQHIIEIYNSHLPK